MAKQHKAATEVTVASMFEESAFQLAVQRYWKPAALVVVAVTGVILFIKYKRDTAQIEQMAQWSRFGELVRIDPQTGFPVGDPGALAEAAQAKANTPAGALAGYVGVLNRRRMGDWQGAQQALADLNADLSNDGPGADLLGQALDGGPSLRSRLEESIEAAQAWDAEHAEAVFSNPPLAEDCPKVQLHTTAGDLVVGLYPERAPKHCENFLKLCSEGFYDGTKFHRTQADFMIQGGDPNSREGEPETWGQGGPDYKLAAEPNGLLHFSGVLAAAKMSGDQESSGSQFYLTVGDSHFLDGEYTVFGALIQGADVAKAIADAPRVEGTERPVEPVEILSATRL